MNRLSSVVPAMLFVAAAIVAAQPAPRANRPNIVLLLADDLGWGDVGFHGSEIKTPNLDRLAAAGARLEQFYVQPVCSPTRAALMTGRYPMRYGLQVGVVRPWAQLRPAAGGADAAPGPQGGGLRDGHLRQVAPGALPARLSADPPRLRPSVRPLQRRDRLLHPRPRRRPRLAPRRQGLPRRGLQHAPDRPRGRAPDRRARSPASRSSSTCPSTPSTRRSRCRRNTRALRAA